MIENTEKKESPQVGMDSLKVYDNYSQECGQTQAQYSLISLRNMFEMDIPPRKWIAYPIIQEKALVMLFAQRGIGKTHVAMTLAIGVASGKDVLGFKISEPHSVVYIDGEMAASDFINRAKDLCFGLGICNCNTFDNLHVLSNDLQPAVLPNLGIPSGQQQITGLLQNADLIILDNLSVLSAFGRENEAESWTHMQRWLLKLKRDGKSVLVIDHSGKNQDNRGTSKKQDIMDTVVALSKPETYKPADGAHFILTYQKSRNVCGTDVMPQEYQLHADPDSGFFTWKQSTPTCGVIGDKSAKRDAERLQVHELRNQGKTYQQIADIMHIGRTKVCELANEPIPKPALVPNTDIDEDIPIIELDDLDKVEF